MTLPWTGRSLHFVGACGAGMSGLALIAKALGASVTGSDQAVAGPYGDRLRAAGIHPAEGHAAANVPAGAEVVFSTAVPADNPERAAAATQLHRAELLGELTRIKPTIAVGGTHGKTTTSSMVVHALTACGLDPAYVVGGEVRSTGTNAAWGDGPFLVVEADESDRSLLKLTPAIAVLTNAELDHHETYGSLREVLDTFRAFMVPAAHAVVLDRPELLALRDGPVTPYDVHDAELTPGGSRFTVDGVQVDLTVPGAHNAVNAAGALLACRHAGADLAVAAASLRAFTGAGRRFEPLGRTTGGAEVYDDYAHHPTEVAATLAAARTFGPRRLVAVFQPHLFSRTRAEAAGFGAALAAADLVVVTGIYPARERQEDFPGVTGRLVATAAADRGTGLTVAWLPALDDAYAFLAPRLRGGDLCLTIGAGDVDGLGRRLVAG